jgi:hypothetical protein
VVADYFCLLDGEAGVRHFAGISLIATIDIPLSQNVDALSFGAAARTAPKCSRHIHEPKGSCRQHFGAGKVNLN